MSQETRKNGESDELVHGFDLEKRDRRLNKSDRLIRLYIHATVQSSDSSRTYELTDHDYSSSPNPWSGMVVGTVEGLCF